MNKELLQKAIERISQDDVTLGSTFAFHDDGRPCCAIGHMAFVAGIAPDAVEQSYAPVGEAYGLDGDRFDNIWQINDRNRFDTSPQERKDAVVAYLKDLLI